MKNIRVETIAAPAAVDPAIGPLTLEHRQEFALARKRARPIFRAATVASFNAWAMAVVAMISAPFALFNLAALVISVALSAVAVNEFRGRRRLLQFNPSAPAILGWNQLIFLVMIITYCIWSIYANLYGANSITEQLRGLDELNSAADAFPGVDMVVRNVVVVTYGSLIVLSVVFQGLNALYYFTRKKHIEGYLAETPQWIRELHRLSHSPDLADMNAAPRVAR
jgi:hypothetical protein